MGDVSGSVVKPCALVAIVDLLPFLRLISVLKLSSTAVPVALTGAGGGTGGIGGIDGAAGIFGNKKLISSPQKGCIDYPHTFAALPYLLELPILLATCIELHLPSAS